MQITEQTALNSIPYLSQRLASAYEQDALKSAYIEELLEENKGLKEQLEQAKVTPKDEPEVIAPD